MDLETDLTVSNLLLSCSASVPSSLFNAYDTTGVMKIVFFASRECMGTEDIQRRRLKMIVSCARLRSQQFDLYATRGSCL